MYTTAMAPRSPSPRRAEPRDPWKTSRSSGQIRKKKNKIEDQR
jgi:hypothetical protein